LTEGAYNIDTGEFMMGWAYLESGFCPKRPGPFSDPYEFLPNGPWATFSGECVYQVREITEFQGSQVELGTSTNPEMTPKYVPGVIGDYQTRGFMWNISFDTLRLYESEVIEIFRQYTQPRVAMDDWGTNPFIAEITGPSTSIPPCTVLTMVFTPRIRLVTLQPVFHVGSYKQDISRRMNKWVSEIDVEAFTTWRNWGGNWQTIFSPHYALEGLAEVVTEDQEERSVAGVVNYYHETQPQCP
jgi:hypothetical protein